MVVLTLDALLSALKWAKNQLHSMHWFYFLHVWWLCLADRRWYPGMILTKLIDEILFLLDGSADIVCSSLSALKWAENQLHPMLWWQVVVYYFCFGTCSSHTWMVFETSTPTNNRIYIHYAKKEIIKKYYYFSFSVEQCVLYILAWTIQQCEQKPKCCIGLTSQNIMSNSLNWIIEFRSYQVSKVQYNTHIPLFLLSLLLTA